MGVVIEGATWSLIFVFLLSVSEKTVTLWTRTARWHPVMLPSGWRRRWAGTLVASSLAADVLALALLVRTPYSGALLSLLLLAMYTWAALAVREHAGEGCRCMWRVLKASSTKGLVLRNAMIAGVAALVAAVEPAPSLAAVWVGPLWLIFIGVMVWVVELPSQARSSSVRVVDGEGGPLRP